MAKSVTKWGEEMLIGEFNHNLDAKGRLTIPSKFREDLGETFMITKGLDGCLIGYNMEEWNKFSEKINALPSGKPEARAMSRFFFSGASDVELDKQGRILIPPSLRAHANLTKEVYITGASSRIEIWDAEAWEKASNPTDKSIEEIAQEFGELGLF